MNFKIHPAIARWATGGIVAMSATTFVASDGFATTRRIFSSLNWSGSSCQPTGFVGYFGTAMAFDGSGGLICSASARVASTGSTTYADAHCVAAPATVQASIEKIDTSTGDVVTTYGTPASNTWPSTATTSGSAPGCTLGASAWGNL